jgi:hypothetical protein
MQHSLRRSETLIGQQLDRVSLKIDYEAAAEDEEELVVIIVLVPMVLSIDAKADNGNIGSDCTIGR